jgi:hypothetical protein
MQSVRPLLIDTDPKNRNRLKIQKRKGRKIFNRRQNALRISENCQISAPFSAPKSCQSRSTSALSNILSWPIGASVPPAAAAIARIAVWLLNCSVVKSAISPDWIAA